MFKLNSSIESMDVGVDVDGILNKGTTFETMMLIRLNQFQDKLAHVSSEKSTFKQFKEIATMLMVLPYIFDQLKHAIRFMDPAVLEQLAKFKEEQISQFGENNTMLAVVSGRSNRLKTMTQKKVESAGYTNLFDAYLLRPPGYSSAGWKAHVHKKRFVSKIRAQIDDDPLVGHVLAPTGSQAFIVNTDFADHPEYFQRIGVRNPSGLYTVHTVGQALAGISKLR